MPLKKINLHHKGMNHHETLKKWRLVEHHHFFDVALIPKVDPSMMQ